MADSRRDFALVLLSGGLDSTTVAAQACAAGYRVGALTVRYGQRHSREVESARRVAAGLGIEHRIVDASFFGDLAWFSALTSAERFDVPEDRPEAELAAEIPITYVPLRNTFFLTLGAAMLESAALAAIESEGIAPEQVTATLFIAANAIDYSGYPDCRPEYYAAVQETLRLGSKLGTQYGVPMRIETPLIALSKADIVRLAMDVRAPLEHTWSCYADGDRPCGRCDSCQLRAKGFGEASVTDPAL